MEKSQKILLIVIVAAALLVGYFIFSSPSETDENGGGTGTDSRNDNGSQPGQAGADNAGSGLTDVLGVLLQQPGTNAGISGEQSQQPVKVAVRTLPEFGTVSVYALPSDISTPIHFVLPNGQKVMANSAQGAQIIAAFQAAGKLNVLPV